MAAVTASADSKLKIYMYIRVYFGDDDKICVFMSVSKMNKSKAATAAGGYGQTSSVKTTNMCINLYIIYIP